MLVAVNPICCINNPVRSITIASPIMARFATKKAHQPYFDRYVLLASIEAPSSPEMHPSHSRYVAVCSVVSMVVGQL